MRSVSLRSRSRPSAAARPAAAVRAATAAAAAPPRARPAAASRATRRAAGATGTGGGAAGAGVAGSAAGAGGCAAGTGGSTAGTGGATGGGAGGAGATGGRGGTGGGGATGAGGIGGTTGGAGGTGGAGTGGRGGSVGGSAGGGRGGGAGTGTAGASGGAGAGGAGTIVKMLDIADVWSGHPVGFALVTTATRQYVAYYDTNRDLTVAQRALTSDTWTFARLPTTVGWDSHNYIAMDIDSAGFIHVSGNMHAVPLIYFRSTQANNAADLLQRDDGRQQRIQLHLPAVLPRHGRQPGLQLPRRLQRQRQPHLQHLRHRHEDLAPPAERALHRRPGPAQRVPGRPGARPRRLLAHGLGVARDARRRDQPRSVLRAQPRSRPVADRRRREPDAADHARHQRHRRSRCRSTAA